MNHDKKYPILVVDDEKEVTMSLRSFFEALGHEMYTALDGEEANKVIDEIKPELVILDIRMPKVDGKEILRRIKSNYSRTKVIIITAYEEEKEEVEKMGADGFFTKPLDLPALIERIKEVLETSEDTKVSLAEGRAEEGPKKTPKAKVLFIEPNINIYGYTCGLFNAKEFNPGEYETKVVYSIQEALHLFNENSIYGFSPDLVIIYDFNTDLEDVDELADYIMALSYRPREVIMHGIFPRTDYDIVRLRQRGIKYCAQNVLTDEDFRKMNKKLIDFVRDECISLGLVK